MPNKEVDFKQVQTMFELCTNGKDLREFCHDIGVNYDKYMLWQRRQLWCEKTGKEIDDDPAIVRMHGVSLVGKPQSSAAPSKEEAKKDKVLNPVRFMQLKLNDGVSVRKFNITAEEAVSLITKLTAVLC